MKILVLGKKGMLGHVVFDRLKKAFDDVEGYDKEDYDVEKDFNKLAGKIKEEKFEVVVNCIGLVKSICKDPKKAIYLNSLFPHILAEVVNSYDGKVIHISTDCVFDGKKGNYKSDDVYTANDLYGMSKALGELKDDKNLTIRTSMIGRELEGNKRGLVEWFLQQEKCNGYKNHIWSGLTTDELANVIVDMIKKDARGLKTVALPKPISKHDLLLLLKKRYKKDTEITPVDADESIDRSMVSNIKVKSIEKQIDEMH